MGLQCRTHWTKKTLYRLIPVPEPPHRVERSLLNPPLCSKHLLSLCRQRTQPRWMRQRGLIRRQHHNGQPSKRLKLGSGILVKKLVIELLYRRHPSTMKMANDGPQCRTSPKS